ncbi:MAG: hypothetical protein WCO99_15865, partial [Planctomycetota bacterium]
MQPDGGGYLVFSDVPQNKVYQWKEGAGLSVFLEPSGSTGLPGYSKEQGSNGLAINAAGELISCEHGDRRVSVLTHKLMARVGEKFPLECPACG